MLVSQQVHSVRATDNRIYCENEKNTIKFLNAFNASSPRHTCNPPMHTLVFIGKKQAILRLR